MNKFEERYEVVEVENKLASEIIVAHHYLHRRPNATKSYAMKSKEDGHIVGILQFGLVSSPAVEKGVCGEAYRHSVIELKRLFVFDETAKNAESWFIGQVLKICPYEIILSFAEPKAGHLGIVYQSTNFMFCGASIKFNDYIFTDGRHPRSMHKMLQEYGGGAQAYKALGDGVMKKVARDRKYRYIMFNADKKRKKELMANLRYDVFAYPKTLDVEEWEANAVVIRPTTYKQRRK